MGSDSIPLWIIFFICVIGGAYFAAAESSFSAVNKIKIKALADDGDKKTVLYFEATKKTLKIMRYHNKNTVVIDTLRH